MTVACCFEIVRIESYERFYAQWANSGRLDEREKVGTVRWYWCGLRETISSSIQVSSTRICNLTGISGLSQ